MKFIIFLLAFSSNTISAAGLSLTESSSKIQTQEMTTNDVLNINMCQNSALTISLDNTLNDSFSNVVKDSRELFIIVADNERSVYIHLAGFDKSQKESVIRLHRKSDDKIYLVNIISEYCKNGLSDYPKVVYIKEKATPLKTLTIR